MSPFVAGVQSDIRAPCSAFYTIFPMDVPRHACLSRYRVKHMIATLETAIRCERVAMSDAEDYLLHVFGGQLAGGPGESRASADG